MTLGNCNVQAQSFLKKLGNAVDKATKSGDGSSNKKTAQKNTTTKTNLDENDDMIIGGLASAFSEGLAPVRDSYKPQEPRLRERKW